MARWSYIVPIAALLTCAGVARAGAQGGAGTRAWAGAPVVADAHPHSPLVAPAPAPTGPIRAASLVTPPAPIVATLPGEAALLQRRGLQTSQKLMIFGGALLVTGLVIGDQIGTVIAIGGAGIGLYGLYRYLWPEGSTR